MEDERERRDKESEGRVGWSQIGASGVTCSESVGYVSLADCVSVRFEHCRCPEHQAISCESLEFSGISSAVRSEKADF
ncbi:hypothetical protein Leryth_016022 [Lithospermum erythrorhizon]|nr:hypothetical protein Leryth_016022 [Lithospermum erythrorhizon]